jgi:O-antigen/teichoic acid export membrane protein
MIGAQMLLGLFDFGFGQTLQRRIAFAKGRCGSSPDTILDEQTRQHIRDLLATARRVYYTVSAVVLLVLLAGGPLYFNTLQLSPAASSSLRIAWAVMAMGYAANIWGWFVESTLNGLGDIGWSNIINSVMWVVSLAAIWIALASGGGLTALALIWVMRGILLRVWGWMVVRRFHPWIREFRGNWRADEFRTMVEPSLKWWIAIVGTFLTTGITRYFIGSCLGVAAVSDYVATFTALSMVQAILVSLVGVTIPLQSQMWQAGDLETMRRYVTRLTRLGLVLLVIAYAFICVNGKEIFELWLGQGHFVGYPVLALLSIMMLLEAHHGMLNTPCIAAERLQFYKYTLLGGFINVGLIVLLVARWGLLGIAVAVLIAHLATNNWIIPKISLSLLKHRLSRYFTDVILPVLGAGAVAMVFGLAIKQICRDFIISAVAYSLVLFILGCLLRKQFIAELADSTAVK